jgi:hypothetical protein
MIDITIYLKMKSGNSKVGPIPVSTSPRQTCPPTCSLIGNGCYADNFPMKIHWDRVSRGEKGYAWADFLGRVRGMKKRQIWRHNQAGDLISYDSNPNRIDQGKLFALVRANEGKRGFTYTHYPMTRRNKQVVRAANRSGFTINLSADNVDEADRLASLGVAPVVVILPLKDPPTQTPQGRKITQCPAQTVEYMTCAVCQLCVLPDRKAIVGFVAHGARKKTVDRVIKIVRHHADPV